MLDEQTRRNILAAQKNEITEHIIYNKLAQSMRESPNHKVLQQISRDELRHHDFWREQTGEDAKPDRLKIWFYYLVSRLLGLTFGVKLMEKGEEQAQVSYNEIAQVIPEAKKIAEEEDDHEQQLIAMIDEERLKYVGSIVLGLNDALVELTGALAGFTFALQNTRLIAVTGLIMGFAASLSMAASEYLSTKTEASDDRDPVKASAYTGFAYVLTVLFLIFPYFLFTNVYHSLGLMMLNAVLVILFFTFYVSVAQDVPFRKRFLEMAGISLGVAALTFCIGYLVRVLLNVEV